MGDVGRPGVLVGVVGESATLQLSAEWDKVSIRSTTITAVHDTLEGLMASSDPIKKELIRISIIALYIGLCLCPTLTAQTTTVGNYDDCILEYMKGVTSDIAAEAIKQACRRKFPSQWKDAGAVRPMSPPTANNSYVAPHSGCDGTSPEGKYCADEVAIFYEVPEDEHYEYRIKEYPKECPYIDVASGPKGGWMHVIGCSLSIDRTSFTARIKGWTLPQVYRATLDIERRVR